MTTIPTCTFESDRQMLAAIKSGKKIALHLECIEKPNGLAIFCKSIEEARAAFRKFAKGWEQFMVCEYPRDSSLDGYKQIAIGWL